MVVKINVSIPKDILEQIDRASEEAHTSRSAFLAQAAKHFLEERDDQEKRKRREEAARRMDQLREEFGDWDATGEILKWRQLH